MKIVGKDVVWQGNYLRSVLISYVDNEGMVRNWESAERHRCSGIAVIVPVTRQREVLLVRQFRPPVGNFVIEVPAGLRDREESLVDTARRELIEETGWVSGSLEVLAEGPVSAGMSSEQLTVFLARDVVPAPPGLKHVHFQDTTERIEIIIAPLDRAYQTFRSFQQKGDCIDLKLYGLIDLALKAL